MKKTLFLVVASFVVSLLCNATQAYGMEMSAEQKELWEKVQKAWEWWKNGDIEAAKAATHKDYNFWSSSRLFPQSRDDYLNGLFTIKIKSYELEPVEISILGNLALVSPLSV